MQIFFMGLQPETMNVFVNTNNGGYAIASPFLTMNKTLLCFSSVGAKYL